MMTAAAMLGIDSCPIGGFDADQVKALLKIDASQYEPSLILSFGYRLNPQPEKMRLPWNEVVEVIV